MPRDSAPISTSQRSDGLGRVELSCAASRHLFSSLSWERRRKGGEFHPLGAEGGEKEAVRYMENHVRNVDGGVAIFSLFFFLRGEAVPSGYRVVIDVVGVVEGNCLPVV